MTEKVKAKRPPVSVAARRLRRSLKDHGVLADVHDGDGVALVWVARDLVVWCQYGPEGLYYLWCTGRRYRNRPGLLIYARCPAYSPATAARRVVQSLKELPTPQVVVQVRPGSPISGPG